MLKAPHLPPPLRQLSTEVITGIKAIKLYAWEEAYVDRITSLRVSELEEIRTSALVSPALTPHEA